MYIVYCSANVYDTYTKYNPVDVRWDVLNHTMSQYNLHYNHILWLKGLEIQSLFKSCSKCVFVDQLSRVVSRSYPSGSAWSSQMSTAKKNLDLYIVDSVVRVISISQPMERCNRTLNSAARLVATNCKKVGPKCSADNNMKYWHKCPKIKIL